MMNRSEFFKSLVGAVCGIPLMAKTAPKEYGKPLLETVKITEDLGNSNYEGVISDLVVKNSAGETLPMVISDDFTGYHEEFDANIKYVETFHERWQEGTKQLSFDLAMVNDPNTKMIIIDWKGWSNGAKG